MSASVKAVCVDPAKVDQIWPLVSDWIVRAMERGGTDGKIGEIEELLRSGGALLWLGCSGTEIKSAGVTSLTDGVCDLLAYGGSRQDHLLKTIEEYARAEGCKSLRVRGRKGWARVLKNYSQPYIVLERQL